MRKDIYNFMSQNKNEKLNYAAVARQFNCDPRVARKYHENFSTNFIRKPRKIKHKIDEYKDFIENKLNHNTPCTGIYNELKKKGFKGSLRIVQIYAKKFIHEQVLKATVRFETFPGLQAQVDRKEKLILVNKYGETFKVSIFLMVLGFSRMKYLELTTDQNQKTLFNCMINAFKYFGGVPKEILFDNMKTVVDRARSEFEKPCYNESFVQFAKDCEFIPLSCIRYRPQTKGKVENLAKLVNRIKVYNEEFETLEELKLKVDDFLKDINEEKSKATKISPIKLFKEKEKEYLKPFNSSLFEQYLAFNENKRKVTKECLVTFNGSRYSVPKKYIGKTVECKLLNGEVYFYFNNLMIAKHKISEKLINYNVNHYIEALRDCINSEDEDL